jgi:hypothetical protein
MLIYKRVPSGKRLQKNNGKIHHFIGYIHYFDLAMFITGSYVSLPEGICIFRTVSNVQAIWDDVPNQRLAHRSPDELEIWNQTKNIVDYLLVI